MKLISFRERKQSLNSYDKENLKKMLEENNSLKNEICFEENSNFSDDKNSKENVFYFNFRKN